MTNIVVSLRAIIDNIKAIKTFEKKIIFVVKGRVYGYGFELIPQIDLYVDSYAVTSVYEASVVKKYTKKNVLILSPVPASSIVYDKQFTYTICSIEQIRSYIDLGIKDINIALKVNTGLNRFGVDLLELIRVFELLKNNEFKLKDMFTHLATSTLSENEFDEVYKQYEIFKQAISLLKSQTSDELNLHFTDSASLLRISKLDEVVTSIRSGMFILGIDPISNIENKLFNLSFPLEVSFTVLDKHQVNGNGFYGYEKRAKQDCFTVTIGMGYCDGMRKAWIGERIIESKFGLLKLLDVSMNTSVIEVPQSEFNEVSIFNTKFILLSSQKKLNQLACLANTSIEDILCGFDSINNQVKYVAA